MLTLITGAFLISASLGFSTPVIGWLGLGAGALVALTLLCSFAVRGRGIAQRVLDGSLFVLAAWTIVASRCFGAPELKWLTFANGATMVLLAAAGLILHEALTQLELARPAQLISDGDGDRSRSRHERSSLGVVG
jgi:hypothetical protein